MKAAVLVLCLVSVTASQAQEIYFHEANSVKVAISIPVPGISPLRDKAEDLRKRLGAPETTYIGVLLDNRKGQQPFSVSHARIVTEQGESIVVRNAAELLADWSTLVLKDVSSFRQKDNSILLDIRSLNQRLRQASEATPGKTSVFLLASKQVLNAQVKSVFLYSATSSTPIEMRKLGQPAPASTPPTGNQTQ